MCNPTYLLKEARKLGRLDKVKVSSLDERRMTELGMGALLHLLLEQLVGLGQSRGLGGKDAADFVAISLV